MYSQDYCLRHENHSLTCWSSLGSRWWTMRGQGLTLLTTLANFRILLLSVPRFLKLLEDVQIKLTSFCT